MQLKQFFSLVLVFVAVANFIMFLFGRMDLLYFWLVLAGLWVYVKWILPGLK